MTSQLLGELDLKKSPGYERVTGKSCRIYARKDISAIPQIFNDTVTSPYNEQHLKQFWQSNQ